eukprot:jgi/Chlat1/1379/Chrsp119S01768
MSMPPMPPSHPPPQAYAGWEGGSYSSQPSHHPPLPTSPHPPPLPPLPPAPSASWSEGQPPPPPPTDYWSEAQYAPQLQLPAHAPSQYSGASTSYAASGHYVYAQQQPAWAGTDSWQQAPTQSTGWVQHQGPTPQQQQPSSWHQPYTYHHHNAASLPPSAHHQPPATYTHTAPLHGVPESMPGVHSQQVGPQAPAYNNSSAPLLPQPAAHAQSQVAPGWQQGPSLGLAAMLNNSVGQPHAPFVDGNMHATRSDLRVQLPAQPVSQPQYSPPSFVQPTSTAYSQSIAAAREPVVVNAATICRKPGRSHRPDRIAVILRGLPGSGKSHLAKALRDVEVFNGGAAPRIHALDDYFMTEVDKEVVEGKKRVKQRVTEYVYEEDMADAYKASMVKAFKKTVEESQFPLVIVDSCNLLVADVAQYWTLAKRSGYEVYVLQPLVMDPEVCAKRNIHGWSKEQVSEMAKSWEPCPFHFLQLDVSSLFKGDELGGEAINEVEMEADEAGTQEEHECRVDDGFAVRDKAVEAPQAKRARGVVRTTEASLQSAGVGSKLADVRPPLSSGKKPSPAPASASAVAGDINALKSLGQVYGGAAKKRVRWADETAEKQVAKGFQIGHLAGLSNKAHNRLERGAGASYNDGMVPLSPGSDDDGSDDDNNTADASARVAHHDAFVLQAKREQQDFKNLRSLLAESNIVDEDDDLDNNG